MKKLPGSVILPFNLINFSLAFVFLSFIFAGCMNAQRTINLSTDEAVLEQLERVQNKKFSKNAICIERVKEPSEIIVIGAFRYDYGCHLEGVFVNKVYYENGADLSKNALSVLGWKKWNREMREKMALAWVEKVLLSFSTVLYSQRTDFKEGEFSAPQIFTKENGETVVRLWTSMMRRKKEFHRHELKFAEDGALLEKLSQKIEGK